MYILGISCYYHDSSACLLKDGKIIAAAQEERFNRDKYSPVFPIQSINYCLQEAGITTYDLDHVTFYEKMYLKFERTIISHLYGFPFTLKNFVETMPLWMKDRLTVPLFIREELSYNKKIWFIKHHLSHASSSFYLSGFEEAAILTVDGVGEYATTTCGIGKNNQIEIQKEINYPHSIGLLYSIVTAYLGFKVFSGEGKVMALAEYGQPSHIENFKQIIDVKEDGSFCLELEYFSFNKGEKMYSKKFESLFGEARLEDSEISQRHKDIACSLQRFTEEVLLKMCNHLQKETGMKKLCLAGGVFLNVTANSRILRETKFEEVYLQPAAGDAGSALGSALYLHHAILGNKAIGKLEHASLGPKYADHQIEILLKNKKINYIKFEEENELLNKVVDFLIEEKVVAWFQGRMEFGPRALGNRSLLADPRSKKMKDWINLTIKKREDFRPFGASVLKEKVNDIFDFDHDSPFMGFVANIREKFLDQLPAIKHINNTSRIQTVTKVNNGLYYDLIFKFFQKTNIPLLLNTSFNDSEPIICNPQQAIEFFLENQVEVMVIENYLAIKTKNEAMC